MVPKRPVDYVAAVKLLMDCDAEFTKRIGAIREAHAQTPSLLARLMKAGL